ncbi:methylenetetrahydrofolate reductase-domain-containing protein [Protomyces lactucae-debilis]|uniref:Methylenetetrahydrofolate reductase-domain-containing protein n=1 Tax=Protomyces lactucae-debilis TaxID=2754530 RepID=A0A1Y2FFJ1_PROLT|nr:methylenetetrahydrofolate reductase-domain-containing protein [Protomyces lactucae-debilis]ORY82703.1 methylenetetrahydrofolate reductase-domain-containing protein [Protomyces lactucae-debilis]
MRISKKLKRNEEDNAPPSYSYEFFPPKTSTGMQNLYDRIERMANWGPPLFVDVTWGAGGRLAELTTEMVSTTQELFGLDTCMHLICTGMPAEKVKEALKDAYDAGCQNILALRGDPPRDKEKWEKTEGGFAYATDLVKYIRKEYGDYFDIGVAGYSEGHPECTDKEMGLHHLKEKCDAGADFIVTQMFYDVDAFLAWVQRCRDMGITVPIIPGVMPISGWDSFLRRAKWSNAHIPQHFMDELEPVKNDDAAVRDRGTKLVAEMCQTMLDNGIRHLHFYTMNLEKATHMIIERLGLLKDVKPREMPWQRSLGLNRKDESVRPIFWANRHKSYIARTKEWDEFPNGRWGDSRSPAFGELENYQIGLRVPASQVPELWGTPASVQDVADLFARYCLGEVPSLPWSESALAPEASIIQQNLASINRKGYLTINSQPAVNGAKSSDPLYGWGPANGYVYQKAYLEIFVHPDLLPQFIKRVEQDRANTYFAVNKQGDLKTNTNSDGPNAVTWGVFPGKEIIQPTIVEAISFLAWKDEAYRLGLDWATSYDADSPARKLLTGIMDTWYLCVLVSNDFQDDNALFTLFEDMRPVSSLSKA